jgi:murein DD-endopeptidase MepM/ murein hydrolase activator NlpD/uncharacterized protein (DUF2164 family)
MEENNDFEKFDEHKDSVETLLGTNEKSSSMSSRERVDDILENEGAEALSKFGVPEDLGREAIKEDGGKFAPTHGPTQKMAKEASRNKLAEGLDNLDEAKDALDGAKVSNEEAAYNKNSARDAYANTLGNKDYYNKKIEDAKNAQKAARGNSDIANKKRDQSKDRLNKAKEKRKNTPRTQRTDEDKKELADAKKENKEAKNKAKSEKNGIKKAHRDERNAKINKFKSNAFKASHPVQAASMAAKYAVKEAMKKVGKKILLAIAPYVIGAVLLLVLIIFVIELILGPIMEAWGYIDDAITGVSNFSEKLSNFYYGFGFQDSKEAFYDELEDLCDKYTCSNDGTGLDVPMVLATLFYTEGAGYDTAFNNIEEDGAVDETISGSSSGALASIREWLREKYDESKETVDENGLTYNAGKIYRLRKLARNQFYTNSFGLTSKKGPEKTVSLTEFLSTYGSNVATDIIDMLKDLGALSLKTLTSPFKEVYAWAIGSKYTGDYFTDIGNKVGDFGSTFKTLISDAFFGLADITNVDISLFGDDGLLTVNITYREFKYDEENYKKYLINYYFEHMPEYKELIDNYEGDEREKRKEYLFSEIKANRDLFKSIFLQYVGSSSENYTDSCVGAIDQNLVGELNSPVDIADNATVSFTDAYAYGIVNGKNHNGVDLNEKTVGVKLGANVHTVSNGKIESISDSKCSDNKTSCGKSIKISHDVVVGSKEFKFSTIYSNVTLKSGLKKGDKVSKGDIIGTIYNNSSNTEGLHFTFLDLNSDAKGVAIDPTNLFVKCTSGGGTFAGSNNEEAVWNYLLGFGYSKNAVAGIMGNMSVESASTFDGRIVQGDSDPITYSIDYTKKVDSGTISKNDFVNNGPNGGGYGIVQWTYYTIKDGLYDYAKNERKLSIGDTAMQIDYLDIYLQKYNQGLYNSLRQSDVTVSSATRNFMLQFENPLDQSETAQSGRVQRAQDIYNRYSNK